MHPNPRPEPGLPKHPMTDPTRLRHGIALPLIARCLLGLSVVTLSACALFERSEPPIVEVPVEPPRDLVAEIRVAAAAVESTIEVRPLVDPGVEHLKQQALELEREGRYDEGEALALEALGLAPEDPELWQQLAELRIRQGRWIEAEQAALKSFEYGPRIGHLCSRNWLTILAMRQKQQTDGDDSGGQALAEAEERLDGCPLKPLPRY